MEFSIFTWVVLPLGLGLLGFIEPCTIGGHMVFLDTQAARTRGRKFLAVCVFIAARAMVTGLFGALLGAFGAVLVGVQTWLWLVFGAIYLAIGLWFLLRGSKAFNKRIRLAPQQWRQARNPLVLGLAFGLSIPACAAPILFALLGLAAGSGSVFAGFAMMAIFGFGLSMPLLLVAALPVLADGLARLGERMKRAGWLIGVIFVALGLWSVWFGLNVDPADWSGL